VQGLVNGLKLVSELKNQELQHRTQDSFVPGGPLPAAVACGEKQLNKNRSKKDLKNNKFQSSAVAYMFKGQNIDSIEEDLPEKENNPVKPKKGPLDVDEIINQYSMEEE